MSAARRIPRLFAFSASTSYAGMPPGPGNLIIIKCIALAIASGLPILRLIVSEARERFQSPMSHKPLSQYLEQPNDLRIRAALNEQTLPAPPSVCTCTHQSPLELDPKGSGSHDANEKLYIEAVPLNHRVLETTSMMR